ncbi:unnamed protein product [Polarella glacialis]|uniref:Gamma-glutamylcyclotransferase AIG2-like domain-containing protein n=1 Tax=Polarella glacialis TaxID=89957 RepID=A0A813GGK5_POLGL|nr:unnamed protein product [Polarella glacialis]
MAMDGCCPCFAGLFKKRLVGPSQSESCEVPLLPIVRLDNALHRSLTTLGHDPDDVTDVLCCLHVTEEDLARPVEQLSAELQKDVLSRLKALAEEEAAEIESNPEVLAVFAYGTLRGDFCGSGDKWGIVSSTGASWERASVKGFRLYQDPRLTFPFAVRTDAPWDVIHGTVMSWPDLDAKSACAAVAQCNQIEGFRPSTPEAGLYRRQAVEVELLEGEVRRRALIYHQIWPTRALRAATAFPHGDWLETTSPMIQ